MKKRTAIIGSVLLILIVASLPTIVTSKDTVRITYQVNVYMGETQYYTGSYFLTFQIEVTFVKTSKGYEAIDYNILESMKQGLTSYLTIKGMESLLLAPGITHFSLPIETLDKCRDTGSENIPGYNWKIIYLAKSAVSLSIDRIEEGYQVILTFPDGSKEVVYDEETGILLSELFYVKTKIDQTYVVYAHVIEAPVFIGDEGIPRTNILVFQGLSGLLTLMGILAYATRSKYRIL